MAVRKFILLALCFALVLGDAEASETNTGNRCGFFSENSGLTCSISMRIDAMDARLHSLIPAPPIPTRSAFLNFNLFAKKDLSENLRLTLDTDVYSQRNWRLQSRNIFTGNVRTEKESIKKSTPETRLGINEFFILVEPTPAWQVSAGKKRLIWGTGFASNPTDVLNPAKNMLDPTTEKRGSWLVLLENLRDDATYSFFAAPGVVENHNTIPTQVLTYKASPEDVEEQHYIYGVRSYHLIGESDLNLMLFESQRYKDDISHQLKAGVSWSQAISSWSDGLTAFAELLAQRGTSRSDSSLRSRGNSKALFYRVLAGVRYDFSNESALVAEFYRQNDGDSRSDFAQRLENLRSIQKVAAQINQPSSQVQQSVQTDGRFGNSISTLNMQNYLFINYQRYKISDDVLLSWSLIHNLHDASGYTGPSVVWTPSESIVLTLIAQSEFSYMSNAGIFVNGLGKVKETDINPSQARLGFELKSFF
ncbi:MAG: hypothetical protein RJB13_1138 [Pseudomonadota bacterium]